MRREGNPIVALDGYSSTGKSTLAKDIARSLKIRYIDSGAMYRAVTLYALRNDIYDPKTQILDQAKLESALPFIHIDFHIDPESGEQSIVLNGKNVEQEIRTMEISESVSQISAIKLVREKMVEKQRAFAWGSGLIMDGRDIGTVVFPNADVKIFLTASVEVRAKRRYKELREKGYDVSLNEVRENVQKRDHMDETRKESPLRKPSDAVELDNSNLTREEQLDIAIEIIRKRTGI